MTVRKSPARSTQKSAFIKAVEHESNFTLTENMAVTHKSTLNAVLDLFAMGAAARSREDKEVESLFSKAYDEDELLALKTMFYIRDIRGGQGERKVFRTMLDHLCQYDPDIAIKNIENIPEYGRFDDLKVLLSYPKTRQSALGFIERILKQDIVNFEKNESVTLLAKWLPSENASSKETKQFARMIRNYLEMTPRRYRKVLSMLRKHIDIVERKMSADAWNEIKYEAVPSKASLMYKAAFAKHDARRYDEYIQSVLAGKSKINASTVYPYELVNRVLYKGQDDSTLDAIWNNLPDYTGGENAIVVADVSGSMHGYPMAISISLAMYFAERNTGKFKDYFITFSAAPQLVKVQGKTFREKVLNLARAQWDMNTNLQGVFDLILKTAVKNQLPQKELPAKIYIVSDMEFDNACGYKTNLEVIKDKFKAAGYEMPTLVFWNANSHQDNVAAEFDEQGVFLVSGASPVVFKYAMATEAYNPVDFMLSVLNDDRYSRVVI